MKKKLIRTTTVSLSLDVLLKGQLHFLNDYYQIIAISGGDDALLKVQEREQVDVIPIEIQRAISPIKDVISLWKLYQCFKKEQPYIVHSITPKAGLLSMVAAYFAKVPIRMHTFTGLIFPNKKGWLQFVLVAMDKLLCKCATHIYPEGQGVKSDLEQYKITQKPLKVLANGNINGIDTSYFNPQLCASNQNEDLKKELGILKEDVVFIFVGRLVGDKGINELIAAFKTLQNSNKSQHSKLILVGPLETELDPLLPATLQEIKTNSAIISVGYQDDVRPYFAIADVLVFPSYREGFPNVVLQAGAMQLPSIVTNINGCNEIIEAGKNGWIIPVKDAAAVYKAMLYCLENPEVLKEMRNNTRKIITTKFEQKMVWNALLHEYQKLEFELET
ncbi:glycosyltransferase family 4 protein [Lutibacter maritimus]|uniref:Glycosyltransferase involved in cell wall bisynthesis n=1 Tax=Lutibacter maritimus TaxID=593133 RepID=A0A1I6QMC6_9FLAO|nr:glycosyltransferase family 4 protein [Lutibacter maritimus]SFS53595.1 Glycosyltransferase involved in cell wall bisynthesis [Lutibacter maritimus]